MNLKLKATLLWLLAIGITMLSTAILFAAGWLVLSYPEIVCSIVMGVFMIYVLISAWVSIYHYLKSKEETK